MSLLDEKQRNAVLRTLNELRRAAPAKPGEQYGAPGNGTSMTEPGHRRSGVRLVVSRHQRWLDQTAVFALAASRVGADRGC